MLETVHGAVRRLLKISTVPFSVIIAIIFLMVCRLFFPTKNVHMILMALKSQCEMISRGLPSNNI